MRQQDDHDNTCMKGNDKYRRYLICAIAFCEWKSNFFGTE
jgi:hypothetical protein